MREMLYEAVCWRPGAPRPPREEVLSESRTPRYLEGWGRPGDAAVVAVDPDNGGGVGAAWYRLFPPEAPGYGFVDAATPEVAIGVARDWRGRGVGGALLDALKSEAKSGGFDALSLSVEPENGAAVRLYERRGFVRLLVDHEGSWTMKADLSGEAGRDDVQITGRTEER